MAQLLSTVLRYELDAIDKARELEHNQPGSERDTETGLLNRSAWQRVLGNEDVRARHFGAPACVLVIELDPGEGGVDAGLAQQVAGWLRDVARETDFAARTDESAFAVLMVECDAQGGARLHKRLAEEIDDAGVSASAGWAAREPGSGLEGAWDRALRHARGLAAPTD